MVRLTDVIKKTAKDASPEAKISLSEAVLGKPEPEARQEIEAIYESAILRTGQFMDDVKKGQTREWNDILRIAEDIVDGFIVNPNILLSLVNDPALRVRNSNYIYPHSVNASILATDLGLALGHVKKELADLCACTLIHDLGMLKISQKIIDKPSKLTEAEFNEVKRHPAYGRDLLRTVHSAPEIAFEVVSQHHENMDGSGYPEGKKGDQISEYSKVVAVLEVFEALIHTRPYRTERILPFDAVKMLIMENETKFDPKVLKAFLNYITLYPIDSVVLLNNHEIGRVVGVNHFNPTRPIVEIFLDEAGNRPAKPKTIDLAKSPALFIKKAIDEQSLKEAP
jgi:HD-GYP domain-containing protein (c-di-GMP phosphodiesterase class II)